MFASITYQPQLDTRLNLSQSPSKIVIENLFPFLFIKKFITDIFGAEMQLNLSRGKNKNNSGNVTLLTLLFPRGGGCQGESCENKLKGIIYAGFVRFSCG